MSTARRIGPEDWLDSVDEDLRAVQGCLGVEPPAVKAAAYHCQQAAEKLVKTVLVHLRTDFPKTHDIDTLCAFVPTALAIRGRLAELARFTAFATIYRYPGEALDLSDIPDEPQVRGWLGEIEAIRLDVACFIADRK